MNEVVLNCDLTWMQRQRRLAESLSKFSGNVIQT